MKQHLIQLVAISGKRRFLAGGAVEIFPNEMGDAFACLRLKVRNRGVFGVVIHDFFVEAISCEVQSGNFEPVEHNANKPSPLRSFALSSRA